MHVLYAITRTIGSLVNILDWLFRALGLSR